MEQKTEFVLDMLNSDSVSVLQKKYFEFGDTRYYTENVRNAFLNNDEGKAELEKLLPTEFFRAVMSVWDIKE